MARILPEPIAFEWNQGNIDKNLREHNVTNQEAEEVFKNEPKFILEDKGHSLLEKRHMVWGITNKGRRLSVFITIRRSKVRIISARDMHKKERRKYEEKIKTDTKI